MLVSPFSPLIFILVWLKSVCSTMLPGSALSLYNMAYFLGEVVHPITLLCWGFRSVNLFYQLFKFLLHLVYFSFSFTFICIGYKVLYRNHLSMLNFMHFKENLKSKRRVVSLLAPISTLMIVLVYFKLVCNVRRAVKIKKLWNS